ncbi:MAG TPA: tetratricopeptide repeat protein [Candidatus Sulfotelmatobacter sp.]|nr:tetratricopeptide repeat protein [Candidatus Sulfotelmatobacter sp.]
MAGRMLLPFLLFVGVAAAQMDRGPVQTVGRVRVRIVFPDQAPCNTSTRVQLSGNSGVPLAEGSVTGECTAEFFDVPPGRYRVTVTGSDVANGDESDVEIGSVIVQEVEVKARRKADSEGDMSSAAFISVSDLSVPTPAAKEFNKANHLIARQDWPNATKRLQKAVAMYPNYAAAYNNLGAAYSRMGSVADARSALQQAIALNDHLAAAYVNLARVDFLEKNFPDAESLLDKASSLGPPDVNQLKLQAYAQVMDRHFDQAIDTAHRAHSSQIRAHAFLHLAAANAYEQEKKIGDSIAELQTYLSEAPRASQADQVKKAITTLQAQLASAREEAASK